MLIPQLLPLRGFDRPQPRQRALLNQVDDNHITKALRTYPTPKRKQIVILVIKAIDCATDAISVSHLLLPSHDLSHVIEIARQQSLKTAPWTAKVDPAVFRSFLLALRTSRLRLVKKVGTRSFELRAGEGSYACKIAYAVDRLNLEIERRGWGHDAVMTVDEKGDKKVEGEGFDFSAPFKMDEKEEEEMVKAVEKMKVGDDEMEEDVTMDGMIE